jgi:hypothetical protein
LLRLAGGGAALVFKLCLVVGDPPLSRRWPSWHRASQAARSSGGILFLRFLFIVLLEESDHVSDIRANVE